jgi:hypothetical protein
VSTAEFTVEEIFPVSFQPVPFLWGTLKGSLRIGDEVELDTAAGPQGGKVVTIELHKPPHARDDQFSIAIAGDLVPHVARGSVIRKVSQRSPIT